MKLPDPELAQVETSKVTEYLLCPSHPDGRSKAAFFIRFGFRVEDWQILAEALRGHGTTNPVVKVDDTAFGTRYTVEGKILSPDGRNPRIRTVWLIETGGSGARLITAYPI
jgi:uncharacterized protein DUF6883